jgi:tripartite-type tricarboxylate transporter receptor subunit TctC
MTALNKFALTVAGLAITMFSVVASAQDWPAKQPIKLVVGYPPGQTVVIDYKPGAGGAIGAEVVSKSAPDGYTLGLLDNGPLTVQSNFRKMPFDPLTGFTPVTGITKLLFVLPATKQLPAQSLEEIIKLARSKPGAMAYSSSRQGSMHHISGEMFKNITKTHIVHIPAEEPHPH